MPLAAFVWACQQCCVRIWNAAAEPSRALGIGGGVQPLPTLTAPPGSSPSCCPSFLPPLPSPWSLSPAGVQPPFHLLSERGAQPRQLCSPPLAEAQLLPSWCLLPMPAPSRAELTSSSPAPGKGLSLGVEGRGNCFQRPGPRRHGSARPPPARWLLSFPPSCLLDKLASHATAKTREASPPGALESPVLPSATLLGPR